MAAVNIFLSHASADKPFVKELKQALEHGGEIECWLDEFEIGLGDNIAERINQGLEEADYVVFVMSPTSVASKWVREEWTAAYWQQVNEGRARLVPVRYQHCDIPYILKNKKYCDASTNALDAFKELKTFLLNQVPRPVAPGHVGLVDPNFIGRAAQLEDLQQKLSQPGSVAVIAGMPGLGKTTLAREFVRMHGRLFEATYELICGTQPLASLMAGLAAQLGIRLEGEEADNLAALRAHVSQKQCLLVLDNVDDAVPEALLFGGRNSVLVTTRYPAVGAFAEHPRVELRVFTEAECLELFRAVLGGLTDADEAAAKTLFERLGYLPYAVRVAAGVLRDDPLYTTHSLAGAQKLLGKLAHGGKNVEALMTRALADRSPEAQRLVQAMAVCAPTGFRLALAAEVAELPEAESHAALRELTARSLVLVENKGHQRYRLHTLVREAAQPPASLRVRHAECLDRILGETWARDPLRAEQYLDEAEESVAQVGEDEWVYRMGNSAGLAAKNVGRLAQAEAFYRRAQAAARQAQRRDWEQTVLGNQAVILQDWGRLDEALALHQQEEKICRDLGFRAGLSGSLGNQALILKAWGRLDEALALVEQQEQICRDLGDRAGLSRSVGNQALILKAWGRLDEALPLLQQQEQICRDLGHRAGLQASLGNQALILKAWGRLDEALPLLQQQEQICRDLGDRAGLARSLANQANVFLQREDRATAARLYREALAIFRELRMPRETEMAERLLRRCEVQAAGA